MDNEPLFVEDDEPNEIPLNLGNNDSLHTEFVEDDNKDEHFVNSLAETNDSLQTNTESLAKRNNQESNVNTIHSSCPQEPAETELGTSRASGHSDQPVVDKIKLASILKDFSPANDPIFHDAPSYMVEIVKEMLENDFLSVLGRGLGLAQILRMFSGKVRQIAANALVLVLGHRSEDELLDDASTDNGTAKGSNLNGVKSSDDMSTFDDPLSNGREPQTIGFGVTRTKRSKLYNQGGIYHITGPIAVVDILTGVLNCSQISGIVIAHGERVNENSTIAFVIRLLRERHPAAFIKALSDAPERLVMPPSLPLKLRVLGVPTIMSWPRFHMIVDRASPKLVVDEIIVEQGMAIRRQQALLSEMIQAIISDIKRRVPHLDVDFLAPELGNQHSNPDKLNASMNVDTVLASSDFSWRVRNALQSVWHQLSKDGRNSVYSLGTLQQLQHTLITFDARTFYLQLEFACRDASQPWTHLPVVPILLSEARRSAVLRRMPGKFYHIRSLSKSFADDSTVIILCDSQKTVHDLYAYLHRDEADSLHDEVALKELEEQMRKRDEEEAQVKAAEAAAAVNTGRPGRRRVRGGGNAGRESLVKREVQAPFTTVETINVGEIRNAHPHTLPTNSGRHDLIDLSAHENAMKRTYDEIDLTSEEPEIESRNEIVAPFDKLTVVLSTYRGDHSLQKIEPSHIIMYDPNLAFTREVERYVASWAQTGPNYGVEVHFMYYQQSVEELQYLTTMRREKDSFTKSIREKGLMPMHIQDVDYVGGNSTETPALLLSSARRKYDVSRVTPRIVVDVREFRSALPFHIWQAKMDVIPLTLLVGDYVLTPDIVVERKSISDLIGSFRDGRLYQQCEAMLKYYSTACLLIEFDNKSHFTMEPFKDIRTRSADVQREIQENICTLVLRFPELRILWSSSPLHSAQIFQESKSLEAEPDPSECAKAGESMMMESAALSMLEAMPGMTPRTSPLIAKKAANIIALVDLDRETMRTTLGTENGERLWRFVNNVKESIETETHF